MFLTSGQGYYSVPLEGITIELESGKSLQNPNIKFKLLSYSDITKLEMLSLSNLSQLDIYEEICNKCILGILYYDEEKIDFDKSPAGIIDHIGSKILHHSREILKNIEDTYNVFANTVTPLDQMQAILSRYTSTPLDTVREYPLDKLFRDYAVISTVFPEAQPIELVQEQTGKVGG